MRAQSLVRGWQLGDAPLFVYIAWQSVHEPMEAPDRYVKPFGHIGDPTRRVYAGMLAALDEGLGNLTHAFDRKF